jgi:hypothetical protein
MLKRLNIEVPKRLQTLERDHRGYPIPYIVLRDRNGRPHFQINNHDKLVEVVRRRLCALCGKRLDSGAWFIGGRRCFTDPAGAFIDPPAHGACALFAIRVCPYLASPSYARRLDGRTLTDEATPDGVLIVREDMMPDDRPETFGLGHTAAFQCIPTGQGQFVMRADKWESVTFWRHGQQIEEGQQR